MVPTPADIQSGTLSAEQPVQLATWNTASIVVTSIIGFIFVTLIVALAIFWSRKRAARNRLPADLRPKSYHPFRPQQSDKASLLENAAPGPDNDRSSMFSRNRSSSSVSLYVDSDAHDTRVSMENVNLIPLQITSAPEIQEPMVATISNGSGVSQSSSKHSARTYSSLGVSPIEDIDGGSASISTRSRSTSTSSIRYYSNNSPENLVPLQIPQIVRTPSD